MKLALCRMATALVLTTMAMASYAVESAPAPASRLNSMRRTCSNAADKIAADVREQKDAALTQYGKDLAVILKNLKQKGDIDGYRVVQEESERVQSDKTVLTNSPHIYVARAVVAYQEQVQAIETDAEYRRADLLKQYIAALERLVRDLMAQDKMDDAAAAGDVKRNAEFALEVTQSKLPNAGSRVKQAVTQETALEAIETKPDGVKAGPDAIAAPVAVSPTPAVRLASAHNIRSPVPEEFIRQLAAELSRDNRSAPIVIRGQRFSEGQLVDLELGGNKLLLSIKALKGLSLTRLVLSDCSSLISLAGIEGMPLTSLNLYRCRELTSIEPIAGMRLTKLIVYGCSGLKGDLKVLKGMPLTALSLYGCSSLTSLAGIEDLPLTALDITSCTGLTSLEPLAGKNLTSLTMNNCTSMKGDLKVLKDMPLTELSLCGYPLSRLEDIKGLPLTSLDLTNCRWLSSIEPLAGMKLTSLSLRGCSGLKGDLTALRGMPLAHLNLTGCSSLKRLPGIEDAPLASLFISGCEKLNKQDIYLLKKKVGIKVYE
jgi:hypothetical protein